MLGLVEADRISGVKNNNKGPHNEIYIHANDSMHTWRLTVELTGGVEGTTPFLIMCSGKNTTSSGALEHVLVLSDRIDIIVFSIHG